MVAKSISQPHKITQRTHRLIAMCFQILLSVSIVFLGLNYEGVPVARAQSAWTETTTYHATDTTIKTATSKELSTLPISLEDYFWIGINKGRWVLPDNQKPKIVLVDKLDNLAIIWVGFLNSTTDSLLQIPAVPIPAIFSQIDQAWLLAFPNETNYDDMLLQMPSGIIPSSVLSEYITKKMRPQSAQVQNAGYYPWHGSIQVTQDRQNGTNCSGYHCIGGPDEWAWDFGNGTTGWPIYASRGGKVAWINTSHATNSGCSGCDWTTANVIVIDFGDGYAAIYMHLAQDLPQRFSINQQVNTGDLIGYADKTGDSTASHLHFALQPWNSTWNGNSNPVIWFQHSQVSLFNDEIPFGNPGNPTWPNWYTSHVPSGGTTCASVTGEVILYDQTNCGGNAVAANGTGNWDLSSNFNDTVASIAIPSGWSVRLFKDNSWTSANVCIPSTTSDLHSYNYSDGTTAYKSATYMTVYNQSNCPGSVPDSPSLSSPGNGSSNPYNYDLNFQWNSSSGATEYLIEWWGGPYGTMQPCGWSNSTSCHIGTVAAGNTYSWHVKARNSAGESGWSSTWTFTIQSQQQPPSAPSLSSPGNGSNNPYNYDLNFQWNSSSGATEYLIEWWGGPYGTMQPCGWSSSTSCHIGTVAAGNTYSWHVKAHNGAGESGWSSTWTFTIQSQQQPPSAPSLSSPGNGSSNPYNYDLNFQWNSSSGATEYLVEWWGGTYSTMQPCGWSSATSCDIGTVIPGYTYSWHVKARNGAGESGWSDTWTFTIQSQQQTPIAPSLSSPSNGSSHPSNFDLTFQWNSSSGATEYLIEWWGGTYSTMQPCGWNSATSCHIGTVIPGYTYSWHVKARNGVGESGWSGTWSFTITAANYQIFLPVILNNYTPPTPSWTLISNTPNISLWDVDMLSGNDGWMVGGWCCNPWISTIRHWNGSQWQEVANPGTYQLFTIDMINSTEGWAGGQFGEIMHYTNGSWQMVTSPTSIDIHDIKMLSSNDGWAVGGLGYPDNAGVILRYQNGSWQVFKTFTNTLYAIDMSSNSEGWIVGSTGINFHFNGVDWSLYSSPTSECLYDIQMLSNNEGWAVGNRGVILHYINGIWQPDNVSNQVRLYSVDFTSSNDGWAVGDTLYHYTNGGWVETIKPPNVNNNLLGIDMITDSLGWAVGLSDGTILHYGQ